MFSLRNGLVAVCCSALTIFGGCVSQSQYEQVTADRDKVAAELSQALTAGDASRAWGRGVAADLDGARGKLAASEKAARELSARLAASEARVAAVSADLESRKAELDQLIAEKDKAAADAQVRLADAQTALTAARTDLARTEEARRAATDERDALGRKSQQLATYLAASRSESAELKKKVTAAEGDLADARAALTASQAAARQGLSDLEEARKGLAQAEQASADAEKAGKEARQAADDVRKELAESRRHAAEFKATVDGESAELARLRAAAETAKDASRQAASKEPGE